MYNNKKVFDPNLRFRIASEETLQRSKHVGQFFSVAFKRPANLLWRRIVCCFCTLTFFNSTERIFIHFFTIFQSFKNYLCTIKDIFSSTVQFQDTLNPINIKSFCLGRLRNLWFLFGELMSVYCPINKKKPLK